MKELGMRSSRIGIVRRKVVAGTAVFATATATAVAALAFAAAPPAGATYPGTNGKIAYSATSGGADQIWTMTATGSNKERITLPPRENTDPSWNGVSNRIVFTT